MKAVEYRQVSGATKALQWWERQLPVAVKIGVPLIATTIATATVLSVNTISTIRQRLKESYSAQSRQLTTVVQAELAVHPDDATAMNAFLHTLKQSEPWIDHIRVYRIINGVPALWATATPVDFNGSYHLEDEDIDPLVKGTSSEAENSPQNELEIDTPLKINNRVVAAVGVYTTLQPRAQAISASTQSTVMNTTVGIATQLVALILILYWAILKRLARLSYATSLVAAGDLSLRLPEGEQPCGRDEVINVARQFDHMLDAVRSRTQQQLAVAELGQRAVAETNLASLMDKAVLLIAQHLEVEYASVLEMLPDSTLLLSAGVGWKAGFVGQATIDAGPDSPLSYSLIANTLVIVKDLNQEICFRESQLLHDHSVVSSISMPIPGEHQPFGVVSAHTKTRRTFNQDEIHFLQSIANILGTAVERKQVETKLQVALEALQQAQAQLIQTEKMSSLGQMVAGIAHEINNPVSFIYGNLKYTCDYMQDLLHLVNLYQQQYPQPTEVIQAQVQNIDLEFLSTDLPKMLESMWMGAERIRHLVTSLRNFSRLDESEVKDVDLHEGIDSTLLILNNRVQEGIVIIKQYDKLPLIQCYPAQLNQVFMNILNNAIDALLEQAQVNKQIVIQTQTVAPDRIRVRIQDNGPGIPSQVKDKIFDPFFTTKAVGKGTGLGLAICYQIIQKHEGLIEVMSQLGGGTEFAITLPVKQPLF